MLFHLSFLQSNQTFPILLNDNASQLDLVFSNFQAVTAGEYYEGNYSVTPSVNSQVLETAKKIMKEDLQIHAIPYFDVGNNSGGSTVYIGSLDEISIN